ncbi:hypothetical protein BACCOP_00570 [Phocaeicola coprocola DSM 17136]|uniref:Uncharacterized protein n=1 Tax=Phocaeicola coprocola DSM 17136 TaxID=470145 RepID=B3JFC2_9BACT|nr:hypothetical protein BACCOP_00570 [Phocaeicola coprocola DSM 17136]
MTALKEIGRKPNGMRECRLSCGYVKTTSWKVPFDKEHLFEQILSPANLNRSYKAVIGNKGCGGIDNMSCEQLFFMAISQQRCAHPFLDGRSYVETVKVEIPKAWQDWPFI